VEPQQDGERTVTLRRNGDVAAVAVAYHTVGAASVDYLAVLAALDILEREPSGRLYKKLVATKLATEVGGSQGLFRDPYVATFSAEVRDVKNLDKVERIVTEEMEHLGTSKIDPKELERWRVDSLKNFELAFANSQEISVLLSEFIGLGDWRAIFAYRNAMEKVTVADVARVATTYFKASNRTTGRFVPTKDADRAPLTETPDMATFIKGIDGGEVKNKGEVFAATLDNIEKRTTRTVLPSGIKAALLMKKTRGAKVELRLQMHWGDEKSLVGKEVIADLAAELLQRGTKKKSYQDLRDEENLDRAQISIAGSSTGWVLGIETLHDKLPAALELAAEMLRSPSFPAKELELIKEEEIAALQQRLQDPEAIASQVQSQLQTGWPKGDPRYPMTTQERLDAVKKVSVADIQAFYRDFVGANHAELAVVGDFDQAAVTAQVDKLFGGWASKKPYTRVMDKSFGKHGEQKSVLVKDKEMSVLSLGADLAMKDSDPDYAAWLLVGQVLGGDSGSRIWMRVREKEGLSYGAGAWTYAGTDEDVGGVGGYAIVAPQNVAQAKASILDEFSKMANGTITDDELARAKATWIKGDDTNLSSDEWLVEALLGQTFHGRTTEYRANLRTRIQALTAAEVSAAAKKYLKPDMLIVVDAGDSTKAAAK
jgi:zinc protease